MAFRIIYTEPALGDLEQIASWSLEHYPTTTEDFLTGLLHHIDLLGAFPFMGARVKGTTDVRRLLHTPLRVYYRVKTERGQIDVLHIWHRARKRPAL